ncbi:flagellar brake protein [Noviherbaspirillum malthae]|uniref:flagellar brake protein n=1 Tax=Noviherbaspirillum malthae TaxID=1260987 RepID=UPI00188E10AE|nr:flagellar brake protein [Noviherbaspirillum malthae]
MQVRLRECRFTLLTMNSLLNDKDFDERFLLSGRMEILSVLSELIRSRTTVTVFLNHGRDFLLTNLLEARAQHLVFDIGADEAVNRKLESADDCLCIASHHGIRVRFRVAAPQRKPWGDMDAYQARLPTQLLRLQRRETHRVLLPVMKPILLSVTLTDRNQAPSPRKPVAYPLHDLSVEGAGINVGAQGPLFHTGETIAIGFALSKALDIHVSATVRHVTQIAEKNGKKQFRVGMSFHPLPSRLQVAIQRFLIDIELQQRALLKT